MSVRAFLLGLDELQETLSERSRVVSLPALGALRLSAGGAHEVQRLRRRERSRATLSAAVCRNMALVRLRERGRAQVDPESAVALQHRPEDAERAAHVGEHIARGADQVPGEPGVCGLVQATPVHAATAPDERDGKAARVLYARNLAPRRARVRPRLRGAGLLPRLAVPGGRGPGMTFTANTTRLPRKKN
mgnify:CR=1 FL=1